MVVAIVGVVKFGLSEVIAFVTGNPAKAEVGDCITETQSADDMKIVDCTDATAAFKVVGVAQDKTEAAAETACTAFDTAESYLFQWEGEKTATTTGRVVCLASNAK